MKFTVKVERHTGERWQAAADPYTVDFDGTVEEVAAQQAAVQTLADLDTSPWWRVLVWYGACADTTTPPAQRHYPPLPVQDGDDLDD